MSQETEGIIIYSVTDGVSSDHTKNNYKKTFRHFLKCSDTTETDLLTRAQQNPRLVESLVIKHIKHMAEKQRLKHGTIHTHCASIFHFFRMNDINLNTRKIMRFLPPNERTREDRAYTHREIQDILQKADERSRVAVLLMASTGMRIGALRVIQIGDLKKMEEYTLYRITVYANSPRDRYYTFCTPECAAAIDSYLEYRSRFGEVLKPEAPLIRDQFDIKDPFHIQRPKSLSEDSCFWVIKQVLKRSGRKAVNVKQSHGFRKFCIAQMIKAKVDYDSREYLVGHKGSRGLGVNYDLTTEEDRLSQYLLAVDILTINSENRLKHKIHQLESEHSAEWKQLKEQMNELKQLVYPLGPTPNDPEKRKMFLKLLRKRYEETGHR